MPVHVCKSRIIVMLFWTALAKESIPWHDVAWLLLSMLHCSSKDFGLPTGRRGLPATRQVLAELLHAKATADLAASRSGAAPQPLAAFALQHLGRQHGLEQGQQQWLQLVAAVRQHCSDPAVAAFGVACGLMAPEEAPAAQAGALLWAPGNDLSQASHCRPAGGMGSSLLSAWFTKGPAHEQQHDLSQAGHWWHRLGL